MSFKKQDLRSGIHVVETRKGNRYLVSGSFLIGNNGYLRLSDVTDDLLFNTTGTRKDKFDIIKVWDVSNGKDNRIACEAGITSMIGNAHLHKEIYKRTSKKYLHIVKYTNYSDLILDLEVDRVIYASGTNRDQQQFNGNEDDVHRVTFENAWRLYSGGFFYELVTEGL